MPEGKFCNRTPVNTQEALEAVLGDKGGKQYYAEMQELDVDKAKLAASIKNTCKSRTRTWLEMCAHCGLCADRCPTGAWDMQKFTVDIAQAGQSCRSKPSTIL